MELVLTGSLFQWGQMPSQVAFKSGEFSRHVVLIGGLGDGLGSLKYSKPLAEGLLKEGFSLVQTNLTSSYTGFGISSLDQDSKELDELIGCLRESDRSEGVILIGHSTGCQDVVHYMGLKLPHSHLVKAAILQAPVSDRECFADIKDMECEKWLRVAEKMISEGNKDELLPRKAFPSAPITAYRYHSFVAVGGDDDKFSSDFSLEELTKILNHMAAIPCLLMYSGSDEYVPSNIDKNEILNKLSIAMGGTSQVLLPNADHSLSNCPQQGAQFMIDFILENQHIWGIP